MKTNALLFLSILVAPALLIGCATSGREISDAQIAELKKGETTTSDAIKALGHPTTVSTMSDGRKILTYSFAHVQTRPETLIPIVGAFVGGADVRSSAVVLTFDNTGVLQDFTSHKSFNASGVGLAGGAYQSPDRSLPQESRQPE